MLKNAALLSPALLVALLGTSCAPALVEGNGVPQEVSTAEIRTVAKTALSGPSTVLVGAGDIAYEGPGAEQTAKLLDRIPGTVFTLGDNAYTSGAPDEFKKFYQPTWGRHLSRTRPVPGNHEYRTPNAAGYYGYFGAKAGDPAKGYYAFDLDAAWRVIVLNSGMLGENAPALSLQPGSAQYRWLEAELAAHKKQNVIAMLHHPRFSSGAHGDYDETDAVWRLLHSQGVDLVLWGHDHHYERFWPTDANGKRDDAKGMQAFVVGTGGKSHKIFFKFPKHTTAVRHGGAFGVLKLTLYKQAYAWEFVPVAGEKFTDGGSTMVR